MNENSNANLQDNAQFDTFVKHTQVLNVTIANSQAIWTVEGSWIQPANSVLTNCYIVCTDALAITSGDVGYQVGNASAGGQIIAAASDEILDAGTDVVVGAVTYPGMGVSLPAGDSAAQAKVGIDAGAIANGFVYDIQDDTTHVVSVTYTADERTVHVTLTTDTAVTSTGNGNFAFVFEYLVFA